MKLARLLPRSLPTWMAVAFAAGCVSGGSAVSQTGGTTSGSTSAASSSGTTGTGGAAPACPDPSVFFDIYVDGVQQVPDAGSRPVGHFFGAIPAPPQPPAGLLVVESGTQGPVAGSIEIEVQWPGMPGGTVRYFRDGSSWAGTNTLTVTSVGGVGGVIEGAYSAGLVEDLGSAPPSQLMVHGKFRVCRGPNGPGGK